ncbi:MAG: SRPBCC family protein [Pyrinomonadaceae bacterium]|nr:SRPBCC family protein [Pyrinomonadaceae bacterium]
MRLRAVAFKPRIKSCISIILPVFVKESLIHAPPECVFAFHELPDALRRLTPPWERARLIQTADISQVGSEAIIETRLFGLWPVRWVARHTAYDPPRMFEDVQISGPFRHWRHRHIIEPHATGALLRDHVDFAPPLGPLGRLAAPVLIIPRLQKMFDYRHAVTREWSEKSSDE